MSPYKSKEKQKEYWKGKKRQQRMSTPEMSTPEMPKMSTPEMPKMSTPEMVPPLGNLPERPRFLKLSDGQVLDRANPPKATKRLTKQEVQSFMMANKADKTIMDQARADRYERWCKGEDVRVEAFKKDRDRLQRICQSLSDHNVLDKVYLGVRDPVRMDEVAELL